jgi:predicted transcriptional regulator
VLPLVQLGRDLRRRRAAAEMTQAELAEEAQVSQSLVAKLERGRLNPSYESVRRLLEALERAERRGEPRVADVMRKDPVVAEPGERLAAALERMKRRGYSQLPVVERGAPIGSLSERILLDLLEAGASLEQARREPVRNVMGPGFPTVGPEAPRRAAVELLRDHDAVLVVEGGRLVGVVTKSDLW